MGEGVFIQETLIETNLRDIFAMYFLSGEDKLFLVMGSDFIEGGTQIESFIDLGKRIPNKNSFSLEIEAIELEETRIE